MATILLKGKNEATILLMRVNETTEARITFFRREATILLMRVNDSLEIEVGLWLTFY